MEIFTMEESRVLQGPELPKPLQDINVVTSSAELGKAIMNSTDRGAPKYHT